MKIYVILFFVCMFLGLPLGLLLLALLSATSAQGTFEDAETSNDYTRYFCALSCKQ